MLRSMFSGVSGLQNHQIRMDVVANNIANVNTVGFKSSRVVFQDVYSQTIKQASAGTENLGGTNPQQVGLGVTTSAIDVMHTRAAVQYTGSPLDLSISGDGFFVVSDGSATYFTRAGNFYIDENNRLVNSEGLIVQQLDSTTGEPTDIVIPDEYYDISVNKAGEIIGISNVTHQKEVIARLCLANFVNQNSLEKVGGNLFLNNVNSGDPIYGLPGEIGMATVNSGSLEMSNVDLSKEFTDLIVTQRGFQANSRVITTADQILDELINLKR